MGKTTVPPSFISVFPTGAVVSIPVQNNKERGVTIKPRKLPIAEAQIAAASLPSTARVRTTHEKRIQKIIVCSIEKNMLFVEIFFF